MASSDTYFKPGNSGRPKGSRNKFSQDFIDAVAKDFGEHGEKAISDLRAEDLAAYVRTCASLVPKEFNFNPSNRDTELTDADLEHIAAGSSKDIVDPAESPPPLH